MFFDPANTGLLILGASRFQEDPDDTNRAVFRNAYEEVLKYFKSGRFGPGLSSRNIFDGFDQDVEKSELMGGLERFLENRRFDDLFVYICSHGLKDGDFFCFQLPRSDTENPDTLVRFERLRGQIANITKARVYYIIDACFSGLAHLDIDIPPISPEGFQYFSGMRADMLPDGGACILTSNSPSCVGRTIADDERTDISLPLFTHELLEVLKNGEEGQAKYGLSIDHLQSLLEPKIKQRLLENGDWEGENPRYDMPHYSDVVRLEPGKVGLLSRLYLFQNNHESQHLVNEAARRFRSFYSRLERKNEQLDHRDKQIETLREKLETAEETIKKSRAETTVLSLNNQRLEESVGILATYVKRSFIANILFVALVLTGILGGLYFFEELRVILS